MVEVPHVEGCNYTLLTMIVHAEKEDSNQTAQMRGLN